MIKKYIKKCIIKIFSYIFFLFFVLKLLLGDSMAKKEKEEKNKIKENTKVNKKKKTKPNKKDIKEKIKKEVEKDTYSVKEVITVMIFSIGIGFLICLGCINLITGKNYLRVTKDLSKVVDTYYAIVDNYYGDLDKSSLIEGAVEGMISKVGDTFTSYADTEDTESFTETIKGSYEGIGCSIAQYNDGRIVVIDIFDNSPAEKAGLQVGDVITKVDNEDYSDKDNTELSNYIKNSGKEKVVLTIERDNKEMDITVNLSKVEIPYVSSSILENNDKKIGYIEISLFSSNSYKQFKNNLEKVEKEDIEGLIIDVRSNSGGYLSSVTDISNLFLEKGKVIYQLEDASGTSKKKDNTKEKRTYPIAVLINSSSASASEILASVIKESYTNGFVVGTKSYGKGTVQETKKLLDGSMIKYTTQKWITPNGNNINEIGVEPTNEVELSEEYYINPSISNDNQINEALKLLTE